MIGYAILGQDPEPMFLKFLDILEILKSPAVSEKIL